jgi:hypothetical protein
MRYGVSFLTFYPNTQAVREYCYHAVVPLCADVDRIGARNNVSSN